MTLDPKIIASWIGVLIAGGGAVAGFVKFLFWVYDEWQKRKEHKGFTAPRETLNLAPRLEGYCWWTMGKRGDEPTMQIVGHVFATNIASVPVRIPQVELRYGWLGRKRASGMVTVSRQLLDNRYGMFDIAPGETRDVSFEFWVYPPIAEPTGPFTARSIAFIDQFGNRRVVRRLQFLLRVLANYTAAKEPEEFPYEIPNRVEREVVSVLKAEIARYAMCGRTVGGLGSVHIVYQGRSFRGVGGDSWDPNSPDNQLIVPDPNAASLKSDNLEALTGFYGGLGPGEERCQFVEALLRRLDEKKGYLSVSYFIVATLWSVGSLGPALQKARDLPIGETRVFGLGNILMLLNGLLKYRHPDFTNPMLDEIERFTHGLNEHLSLIPAKIAAIRTNRIPRADNNAPPPVASPVAPDEIADSVEWRSDV